MVIFRPSVRPYPPFHSGSYRPIFKILFLFERYDMRDLTFILFVRLSVRLYGRLSIRPLCTSYILRSYCPILKILFCLKGITSGTFLLYFLFVCPFVPLFNFCSYRPILIFYVWKVSHQRPNFYNFCPSVCPFIRPSIYLSVRSVPPFIFSSYRPIFKFFLF